MSSESPSDSTPEFFVDRSLGRHVVPEALRAAGLTVYSMADVYGEQIGQGLEDEVWLRHAGENDWVVLMKDAKIRYRPAELRAVQHFGVRAFCLVSGNLRADEQAARLVENVPRIVRAAAKPGPYIFGVYAGQIRRLWPSD